MKSIYGRILGFSTAALISGCGGITISQTPDLSQNVSLPLDKLKNDVSDANSSRFILDAYCGHLVEKKDDGSFQALYIAAYPIGSVPTLVTPAVTAQLEYHSLIDQTASANVAAAFGVGTAGFEISGQNRLEVSVNTLAFCRATTADKDAISKAIDQLEALSVDLNKIYFVGTATHTQMSVDVLKAITHNEKGAATPIVNFGSQAYSKNAATKVSNYISLDVVKVNTINLAARGASVITMSGGGTTPEIIPSNNISGIDTPADKGTENLISKLKPISQVRAVSKQSLKSFDFQRALQNIKEEKTVEVK